MTLRPHTAEALEIFRELVSSFIDHPEALQVEVREFPGAAYWSVLPHADDYGKVCGRKGAHIRALTQLLARIGSTNGERWRLRLPEPEPGPRRESSPAVQMKTYDPTRAEELLARSVGAALGCDVVVDSEEIADEKLSYLLRIRAPVEPGAFARLTVTQAGDAAEQPLIARLGVLWRAWGHADGVSFRIEAAP